MRMQVRSGGASIPLTTDNNDNPAGSVVAEISSSVYGNYPNTLRLDVPVTTNASAVENTVLYTSNDISSYNYHVFECTAGTVDFYVSVDGTNFSAVAASVEALNDVTTGGGIKIITLPTASGVAVLRGKFRKLRIIQDGTTISNVRGFHGVE